MRSSPQKAADGLLTGAAGMTRAKQEESFRRRNSVGVCTIYVHICIDIFIYTYIHVCVCVCIHYIYNIYINTCIHIFIQIYIHIQYIYYI